MHYGQQIVQSKLALRGRVCMLFLVLNLWARITLNKLCTMNLLFKTEKQKEKAVKRKKTISLIHQFYFNRTRMLSLNNARKLLNFFIFYFYSSFCCLSFKNCFICKSQSDNLSCQGGLKSVQVSNIPPLLTQKHACVQGIFWMGGGVGCLLWEEWERTKVQSWRLRTQSLYSMAITVSCYISRGKSCHILRILDISPTAIDHADILMTSDKLMFWELWRWCVTARLDGWLWWFSVEGY